MEFIIPAKAEFRHLKTVWTPAFAG